MWHSAILERRNALSLRLASHKVLQSTYLSGLPLLLAELAAKERRIASVLRDAGIAGDEIDNDATRDEFPETVELFLPSTVPDTLRDRVCTSDVIEAEKRLRIAQLTDCLINIRRCLRIVTKMIHWKNHNITGQHHGTRSRGIIDRIRDRLTSLAVKYRVARKARLSLGRGDWELVWCELKESDVRSYTDTEESIADAEKRMRYHMREGGGETHRKLSWIWTTQAGVEEGARTRTGLEGMDDSEWFP